MNGYTGRLLEADCFPTVKSGARSRYVCYAKAMEVWQLVRDNQPWNPQDPTGWAGNLHAEVCLALDLEDWGQVCLFTAVGSALDWHGTDAWFEWQGCRVTLDVTKNSSKLNGYKADIIIPPVAIDDPAERQELAATIADELLASLREIRRQEAVAAERAARRR